MFFNDFTSFTGGQHDGCHHGRQSKGQPRLSSTSWLEAAVTKDECQVVESEASEQARAIEGRNHCLKTAKETISSRNKEEKPYNNIHNIM